jgi:hypothetical protein
MLPVLVAPYHDPQGVLAQHMITVTPQLKRIFALAFLGVTPLTMQTQPAFIEHLQADTFFRLTFNSPDSLAGEHHLTVYRHAVESCAPAQILHLCNLDRVAFALQTAHREAFVRDVQATSNTALPLMFLRSAAAWRTHPQAYHAVEQIATQLGLLLFKQELDFVWCHLVLQAQRLSAMLSHLKGQDLRLYAEIVLALRTELMLHPVDWLAWEDPFIWGRDPLEMKQSCDADPQYAQRRLKATQPIIQCVLDCVNRVSG